MLKLTGTDAANSFLTSSQTGYGFADSDTSSAVRGFYVQPLALAPLVDGEVIAGWPDRGKPSALQFGAQATAAAKPTLKTAIQNNLAVARFDGADDRMATKVPADVGSFTMLAVITHSAAAVGTIVGSAATGGVQWRINANGRMELLKVNTASIGTSTDSGQSQVVVATQLLT